MPNDTTLDMKVTYGDFTLDFATLPHTSVMAILRRGVSHLFGSEQASKVTAFFSPDQDTPPEDTPEARAAKKAEFQQKAYDALLAGTIGVTVRGPTVDPITKVIRRLAKAEIVNILAANKLKFPAKADAVLEFPNGDKFTGEQLIDRRIAKEGERLTREAKKIVDDQAKKAKKAQEAAAAEGIAAL